VVLVWVWVYKAYSLVWFGFGYMGRLVVWFSSGYELTLISFGPVLV
jgi:hypothetical protein